MALTWDIVDDVVRFLVERIVDDADAASRFKKEYQDLYKQITAAWRGKAFHRILVSCAMFSIAWEATFGKKVSAKTIAEVLKAYDFKAAGIGSDASSISRGGVTRMMLKIRSSICKHEHTATKTRIVKHDEGTQPDNEFLANERDVRLEFYCTECGKVFSKKIVKFKYKMVLDLVRRNDPMAKGLYLKELIDLLHKEYLLVPAQNPDPRKAQAAAYVAAKIFLKPFVDRGFLKIEDKSRNKKVWWLKQA